MITIKSFRGLVVRLYPGYIWSLTLTFSGLLSSLAQTSGYNPANSHDEAPQSVSLIQLIANPEQWDGKKIQLIGFLRLEFEGDALYLHREDYDQGITNDGIWIDKPKNMSEAQQNALNNGYVLCEGTFHAKKRGHLGLFSGTLSEINRIENWGHPKSR